VRVLCPAKLGHTKTNLLKPPANPAQLDSIAYKVQPIPQAVLPVTSAQIKPLLPNSFHALLEHTAMRSISKNNPVARHALPATTAPLQDFQVQQANAQLVITAVVLQVLPHQMRIPPLTRGTHAQHALELL